MTIIKQDIKTQDMKRDSGKIKTPAVLGAIIDLGNCLNDRNSLY